MVAVIPRRSITVVDSSTGVDDSVDAAAVDIFISLLFLCGCVFFLCQDSFFVSDLFRCHVASMGYSNKIAHNSKYYSRD